jgi:hypothetical protein
MPMMFLDNHVQHGLRCRMVCPCSVMEDWECQSHGSSVQFLGSEFLSIHRNGMMDMFPSDKKRHMGTIMGYGIVRTMI